MRNALRGPIFGGMLERILFIALLIPMLWGTYTAIHWFFHNVAGETGAVIFLAIGTPLAILVLRREARARRANEKIKGRR